MTFAVQCPTCGRKVQWRPEERWRPFCSERCKLIDLGEWASENRAIPAPESPWETPGDGAGEDGDLGQGRD